MHAGSAYNKNAIKEKKKHIQTIIKKKNELVQKNKHQF